MQPNPVPDIYLMKRQKSRAGCMTALTVTLVLAVVAGVILLTQWARSPAATQDDEDGGTVEFPAGAVEAPSPPAALAPPQTAPPAPEAEAEAVPAPAPTAAAPAPPPLAGDSAQEMIRARELLQSGQHQEAREAALKALDLSPGNPEIEAFLSELAMPLLASQRPMPEKIDYTVQSGDFLGKLAATFNTPIDLIARANNIRGANIFTGQRLRLLDGKQHTFAVEVSKSRNEVRVTLDGRFFKSYRAATGRDGITPVGVFKIDIKIHRPDWDRPGGGRIPYGHPDNALGTHYLKLDIPGYGLHGTWEPESIGGQTSDGCIRLLNDDIEELYTILPRGTLVTIIE